MVRGWVPKRSWRWLVGWLGAVLFVATAVVAVWSGDREAMVIAGLLLAGNVLLHVRSGVAGLVALWLLALDVAFWLTPALVSNLANGDGLQGVVVPALLGGMAWMLLVAAGWAFSYRKEPRAETGPFATVVIGAVAVVVVCGVAAFGGDDGPQPGDVEVDLEDTAFVPEDLDVTAGPVAFYVVNEDLFWHTFTIDGTDVDVRLPSRGVRRIEADLDPGTYELICTIPGHESVGMTGTVVVR